MFTFIKWLFYLAILGFLALVLYAYLGPMIGADFSPDRQEVHQEILLEAQ